MASQHIIFAETIAAMKKARKRRAYGMFLLASLANFGLTTSALESDSDSEVDYQGNRGHKLKRRARFTHEGQLVAPSGPEVYREVGESITFGAHHCPNTQQSPDREPRRVSTSDHQSESSPY